MHVKAERDRALADIEDLPFAFLELGSLRFMGHIGYCSEGYRLCKNVNLFQSLGRRKTEPYPQGKDNATIAQETLVGS